MGPGPGPNSGLTRQAFRLSYRPDPSYQPGVLFVQSLFRAGRSPSGKDAVRPRVLAPGTGQPTPGPAIDGRLVSFIVVNYNRLDLLKLCLASLRAQTHDRCEIIVVDNGSIDGSAEYLRTQGPDILTRLMGTNSGFTGGNIAGLELATGDYIALVNNDATLAPDWAAAMLEALDGEPSAGYAGCKIIRQNSPETLDCAGCDFTTSFRGYHRGEGRHSNDFNEPGWVFWATAAAVLYRRSMLNEIGFLDPGFFFGCEDSDLGFRAQLAGWMCLYVPKALAWHHVGASHGLLKGRAAFYFARNVELMWLKNMPTSLMLRFLHHHLVHEAAALAKHLIRSPRDAGYMLMGKMAVIPRLGAILKQRRQIQAARKVPLRELRQRLIPFFSRTFLLRKVSTGA
jgi:GT2 family glycosyltransferase